MLFWMAYTTDGTLSFSSSLGLLKMCVTTAVLQRPRSPVSLRQTASHQIRHETWSYSGQCQRGEHTPDQHQQTQQQLDELSEAHRSGGEVQVWGHGPGVSEGHSVCGSDQGHDSQAVDLEDHTHWLWDTRNSISITAQLSHTPSPLTTCFYRLGKSYKVQAAWYYKLLLWLIRVNITAR